METFELLKKALKSIGEVEFSVKNEGLDSLRSILSERKLSNYDELIFEELIKLIQFEEECLQKALDIVEQHYFSIGNYHDRLAETLIYRIARSNDEQITMICLLKLSALVDHFDESIAKHSKQIFKLADLNTTISLNKILSSLLEKMEAKLPSRRGY